MTHSSGAPLLRLAFVADRNDREADHAALARLASELAPATAKGGLRIDHLCPHCGSSAHGQPLAVDTATGLPAPGVHVSLSRAGGVVALAAAGHPVGIDIESVTAAAAAAFDDVAFTPAERAAFGDDPTHRTRTRAWAAKEAVLKAAGLGLRADPHALTIAFAPRGHVDLSPHLVGSSLNVAPASMFTLREPGSPERPDWASADLVVSVAERQSFGSDFA